MNDIKEIYKKLKKMERDVRYIYVCKSNIFRIG